ncbi:MAG: VWA domain-containing protein [Nitrososphaerales archaeon]
MLKSKKLISIVVISLFIFPMLFASVPIVPTVKATVPITQIGLCIDGSGSISSSNWNIIKSGIANAVSTLPYDSIELTIVQFGGTTARVELYPTIITAANVGSVVATINAMSKIGGTTPMAAGLSLTWNTMKNSPNFATATKQIINIVTDGNPNVPSPTSTARSLVTSARNTAVSQGLDELDAEAIGTNPSINWLRDNVVYPQPGSIAAVGNPSSFVAGWVLPISSFANFPEAISYKFEILIPAEVLTIEKSASPPHGSSVKSGDTITYTITYGNTGSADATNVVIIDAIPTHTTYFTGSASGTDTTIEYSHDGGSNWDVIDSAPVTHIRWTRATLTAGTTGQTVSFKVTVDSVPEGTTISNKASIDSDDTEPDESNTVTHTVTKPPCTCEDVLREVLKIEYKLDEGGFFWTFVNNWFKDIEGKLWSWENSVKNDTMAIWTLTNNIHGWANLTVALDDIKSEIEGIETDISSLLTTNHFNTIIGDFTGNTYGWTNIVEALTDIKSEIEEIDGGATVSITKLDVRVPEQGDVGQSEWAAIWDLDVGPGSTDDLFFFLIVTRADNGQPVTGLTTSDFSVTFYDKDDATDTALLTVASVTESGGVYRIVLSSGGVVDDNGVLKVTVTKTISSETFTGTILIAVKK